MNANEEDIEVSTSQKQKKLKCAPKSDDIKQCILSTEEPVIIHDFINSWNILSWSLDDWAMEIGDIKLPFRVGRRSCTKEPQWEYTCDIVTCTMKEFIHITSQKENENKEDSKWMYFDYKHMQKCFEPQPEFVQKISWEDFGFPDKTGEHSTIWIGSKGAHTPCHMDTYGCNIVAQVYGRKLWVMFPPQDTAVLEPTRVPYEESSIYSSINFQCGYSDFSNIKDARIVELCPGDVLVVPRHWWHYVENLTTAISINMWISLESDDESRLEESLVRYFVASAVNNIPENEQPVVLNPNETDLCDSSISLQQIDWCVQHYIKPEDHDKTLSKRKARDALSLISKNYNHIICLAPVVKTDKLKEILLEKCKCYIDNSRKNDEHCTSRINEHVTIQHVINAFCHPNVISIVKDLILKQVKNNNKT